MVNFDTLLSASMSSSSNGMTTRNEDTVAGVGAGFARVWLQQNGVEDDTPDAAVTVLTDKTGPDTQSHTPDNLLKAAAEVLDEKVEPKGLPAPEQSAPTIQTIPPLNGGTEPDGKGGTATSAALSRTGETRLGQASDPEKPATIAQTLTEPLADTSKLAPPAATMTAALNAVLPVQPLSAPLRPALPKQQILSERRAADVTPTPSPSTRLNTAAPVVAVSVQPSSATMPAMAPPVVAPVAPMAKQILAGTSDLSDDLNLAPMTPSSAAGNTAQNATPVLNRALAPQVAQQVATAIIQSTGTTTEVALNPEELGRVRIALTSVETGLSVSVLAERPETAELMRRNIDLLTRELQDLGFDSLTFTFGDQAEDSGHSRDDHPEYSGGNDRLNPLTVDAVSGPMHVALSGGLDLKL